jgi:hypothetical protein
MLLLSDLVTIHFLGRSFGVHNRVKASNTASGPNGIGPVINKHKPSPFSESALFRITTQPCRRAA